MILKTLEGSVSAVSTPILQLNTNLLFATFFEIFFKYTKSTHLCTLIHEKRRSRLNIAKAFSLTLFIRFIKVCDLEFCDHFLAEEDERSLKNLEKLRSLLG
jgi:hypothetical protein